MSQERERPDMAGALFRAKEQKSENSPPYTGRIKIGGTEYRIAAWVNESKQTGERYFSIKVSEPEDAPRKPAPKPAPKDDDDDSLPF